MSLQAAERTHEPEIRNCLGGLCKVHFCGRAVDALRYRRGSGPAVIVIHEIPGLHPLVIRFADRIVAAGMTVFLPVLFGEPGRPVTSGYALRSMLSAICNQ